MTRPVCSVIAAGMFASAVPWGGIALGKHFEPQGTCNRGASTRRDIDDVTQPMHGTTACTDEGVASFVIVEVFGAQRADRDQAIGAGLGQSDKESSPA